ncbi:hypothetical protein J18TS1_11800 [Oceanobacillus oncorhynchi subsp. incaldanensis]|nr:hypothetical protein J18TS1_11800 [Oceanobacillus oncorhynchi subsp. incaldanensis]
MRFVPFFSLFAISLSSNNTEGKGSRYNTQVVRAVQEVRVDPAGHNIPLVQAVLEVRAAQEDHNIPVLRQG